MIDVLYDFVVYGTILNLVSYVVCVFVMSYKLFSLGQQKVDDIKAFAQKRNLFIKNNVKRKDRMKYIASMFIPTYSAWLNSIIIFYAIRAKGSLDLIKAIQRSNDFAIIKIIDYKFTPIPEGSDNK